MKNKKFWVSLLVCIGTSAFAVGLASCSAEGDLAYQLNDEGTEYTVIGIGEYENPDVVIPSEYKGLPVTAVRYQAFDYLDEMTSVTIPDTVTVIGESAFAYCENLKTVNFGKGVQTIETTAFTDCEALESISFGPALTQIDASAFKSCDALAIIDFGEARVELGESVFEECKALTSVDFGQVKKVGGSAFRNCTELTELTFNAVEQIGANAFADCSKLEKVDLGNAGVRVESNAFAACKKITTFIASGMTQSLSGEAFFGCDKLSIIYFRGEKSACLFADNITDKVVYYYSEQDPFTSADVSYADYYWHFDGTDGDVKHWNVSVGSGCVFVYASEVDNYVIPVEGEVKDAKFDGGSTNVSITDNGIELAKTMLYQNPGSHSVSWRTTDNMLNVYTLKIVKDGALDFEDGNNFFVREISNGGAVIKDVINATATTGNGAKSLEVDGNRSSVYIGIDADFVHAAFASSSVKALELKIYTQWDLRQKLAWYYQNYNGTKVVGNQQTSYISYTDEGDYLLVKFTRDGYNKWKNVNTYSDTDVLQLLFRFARDLQGDETPSTSGQDKDTQYYWGRPGTFYLDDIRGVK